MSEHHKFIAHATLLGGFRLTTPDGTDITPHGRKACCLLAFLLLSHNFSASRERLLGLLWSDRGEEQARGSLRQALTEIRRSLGGLAEDILVVDRSHVKLVEQSVQCDVHTFLSDWDSYARWSGELLDGIGPVDSKFDDWLRAQRGWLQESWLKHLEKRLERASTWQSPRDLLDAAKTLIDYDETHELAHRAAICAYAEMGQVSSALHQYEKLEEALLTCLDAQPSNETKALVDTVRRGDLVTRPDFNLRDSGQSSDQTETIHDDGGADAANRGRPQSIAALRDNAEPPPQFPESGNLTVSSNVNRPLDPAPFNHQSRRRLAAIAFVDVVGYTRLMVKNELDTHHRWMALRFDIIEPIVKAHGGNVVKGTGDGLLLEFGSGLDAVEFCLEAQHEVGKRAAETSRNTAMMLRAAAHLGDIIPETDDVYGDGVNVAARLLQLADPGGIVISAIVHEQVHNAVHYHAADMGFLSLKHIERRVRAFKISRTALPSTDTKTERAHRPSIAVMPLRSLEPQLPDRYFAEGIVHDIVGSLASVQELFVVSSSSARSLAEKPLDVNSVCHMLGVRYLLNGSITQTAERWHLRIELSDADSNSVNWTDRFDFGKSELYDIQDTIAQKVVYALLPHIRFSEFQRTTRKPPQNWDAYDCLLQGMYRLYRLGEDDLTISRDLFEKALLHDPNYSTAHAMMAKWYIISIGEGHSNNVRDDALKALEFASQALESNPADPLALAIFGHTQSFLFGATDPAAFDRAIDAFERAISASPNSAIAWGLSAPTYCYIGEGEGAIDRANRALALSPLEPFANFYKTALTLAHYFNGNYEESVFWGRKTMAVAPKLTANMRLLIASLVALDRTAEARAVAVKMMELDPGFRLEPFFQWYPVVHPEQRDLLEKRLLAAGLPK